MVMQSILICVHRYTRKSKTLHKAWVEVMFDRLNEAYKLAEFFHAAGLVSYLVLAGGVVSNDVVEADKVYELAKKKLPALFELVTDVILERESKNIQENVDEIMKWAKKKNAAIIAISSRDHAPASRRTGLTIKTGENTLLWWLRPKNPTAIPVQGTHRS